MQHRAFDSHRAPWCRLVVFLPSGVAPVPTAPGALPRAPWGPADLIRLGVYLTPQVHGLDPFKCKDGGDRVCLMSVSVAKRNSRSPQSPHSSDFPLECFSHPPVTTPLSSTASCHCVPGPFLLPMQRCFPLSLKYGKETFEKA